MSHRYQQRAFNFIELIISIALFGLIIFGMVKIYLSITHGRLMQQSVQQIQQQGHIALSTLDKYIRQAGDISCLPADQKIEPEQGLFGFHGGFVPKKLHIKPLQETDVIVVGECTSAKGVRRFRRFAFYVAHTNRKTGLGQPITALYKKPLDGNPVEITTGVDGLRFAYGVSAPDKKDINQYVGAPNVRDWSKVKSVQITLSLESTRPELQRVTTSRIYKVWHSYIAIQNRLK